MSAVSWSWRALRGHSVTFAGLFACGILGLSVVTGFRHLLTRLGAPWYVWLIAPIIVVGLLAKKEEVWLPEIETRRKWARRVFFGSIVLAVGLAIFRPAAPQPQPEPQRQPQSQTQVQPEALPAPSTPRRSEWRK